MPSWLELLNTNPCTTLTAAYVGHEIAGDPCSTKCTEDDARNFDSRIHVRPRIVGNIEKVTIVFSLVRSRIVIYSLAGRETHSRNAGPVSWHPCSAPSAAMEGADKATGLSKDTC